MVTQCERSHGLSHSSRAAARQISHDEEVKPVSTVAQCGDQDAVSGSALGRAQNATSSPTAFTATRRLGRKEYVHAR